MARALIDHWTATDSGVGWYQVGGIVTASGARLHAGTLSKVWGDEDRKPSLGHELAHLIGYESRQCADVIACGSGMRRTGGTVQHPTWTHPCSDGVATLCPMFNSAAAQKIQERDLGSREPGGVASCPRCGSRVYRRSRRRWLERLLRRPPMARCKTCRRRFPLPQASGQ